MEIIKAYATKNLCYITAKKMVPKGIVVHSTGANNPYLKRYVDCPDRVGTNIYNNHWNTAEPGGKKICVHAFIGYDKDKKVSVAEILPLDICCWGVGSGSKGSYNYSPSYIQFEICEDGLKDKNYYNEAFNKAVEYCAYLCKKFGFDTKQIVSHKEAHLKGYGSNHGDPEHWMKNFGDTMDDFRLRVKNLISKPYINSTENSEKIIKKGDLVSISKDAVYYNGKKIPSWVKVQKWYVKEVSENGRVVIDLNEMKTNSICSPISNVYLTVVKSSAKDNLCGADFAVCPYLVKITVNSLNIRKGSGTNTEKVGTITDRGVYTIIEERKGTGASLWGKLKSGAGWISLDYTEKFK